MSLDQALRRLVRRVGNLATFAVAILVDDDEGLQRLQVSGRASEVKSALPRLQNYGFTSRPVPVGADGNGPEGLVVAIEQDFRVVAALDDKRYRPRGAALEQGDSAQYTDLDDKDASAASAKHRAQLTRDEAGKRVHVIRTAHGGKAATTTHHQDGTVTTVVTDGTHVTTVLIAAGQVTVTTPKLLVVAPLTEFTGRVIDNTASGNTKHLDEMRAIFDAHVHPENDSGGPTDTPTTQQGPD